MNAPLRTPIAEQRARANAVRFGLLPAHSHMLGSLEVRVAQWARDLRQMGGDRG